MRGSRVSQSMPIAARLRSAQEALESPRKHSCGSIMSGIGNVLPLCHSSLACAAKGSGTGAEEPSDVLFRHA
jgi:hypothetical protein